MRRTRTLSLLLLCLFAVPLSLYAVVQGAHVGFTWGTPRTVANQYERDAMSYTCAYISSLIAGRAGWVSQNYYDAYTYSGMVYYQSDLVRSNPNVDFLATFHVGDMYPAMISGTRHYAYYGRYAAAGIIDVDLYPHTGAKHCFTYIWTCANGDLFINPIYGYYLCYGYTDTQNGTGIVGMPLAWTKIFNMCQDGYANPYGSYTYIGFENVSKLLVDNSEFVNYNYGDFVRRFYYHAVVEHCTINYALDLAMRDMGTWRTTFGMSELYTGYTVWYNGTGWKCKMRVYGNGGRVLPY